ncbi:MAG TPA: type IV secretion system protein, partial [Steroidobacteraceae bacterium]|nr:type IV secretion system protein [Steroidobacteraceae bacterium]
MSRYKHVISVVLAAAVMAGSRAHAQWAVIDVASIAQLVQEVQELDQALVTAQRELQQAQQSFQAITGARGMQNLLAGTVRNYLPTSASQFATSGSAGSAYAAFDTAVQSAIRANAVLSAQQLAVLPPAVQSGVSQLRQTVALLQGVTGTALSTTSARFSSLQQLIGAIGTAGDQKAILELQARISAEQGMLQNDHTKLQAIYQLLQAQEWSEREQDREL